jgi:MoaA/NifB/PqqE/SkfB family radical SAM enzyme
MAMAAGRVEYAYIQHHGEGVMLQTIRYKGKNGVRAFRRWGIPYINSLIHPQQFRPLLCYLFTDWRCNIDCHYCFQYDNTQKGMSWDTAVDSIDWLKSVGCRVLALMGGEPLVRKDFTLEVIRYGADQGFFVYLPTNGRLLDKRFIDEMGAAGVAALNLAVDCVEPKEGLPKCLAKIEDQFHYLVERQKKYGYLLFFNINICRNNIEDARQLTEIAHQHGVGTDYHLNEPPHSFVEVDHYQHQDDGLHILPEQHQEVDDLLDWLMQKQNEGWAMVNSMEHLQALKDRQRGKIPMWDCRAGRNGALIRIDGSLAPCFDLITYYDYDWGRIWEPNFEAQALDEVKKMCRPHCSSTCFYTMGSYYTLEGMRQWVRKHMRVG